MSAARRPLLVVDGHPPDDDVRLLDLIRKLERDRKDIDLRIKGLRKRVHDPVHAAKLQRKKLLAESAEEAAETGEPVEVVRARWGI